MSGEEERRGEGETRGRGDRAWEQHFVAPIAREMARRGVAYMVIAIQDNRRTFTYVMEPMQKEEV